MINLTKLFIALLAMSVFANANSYNFEKVSKNAYVMHGPLEEPNEKNKGFMNNPGAIIGKNGVIVIDPGGSLYAGKLVLEELKKISTKPIIAVFNTHIHGDHWLANKVIKEKYPNVIIYANPTMIKRAKSGEADKWIKMVERLTNGATNGMTPVYPTDTTTNLEKITIDGELFVIHKPTVNAHTNTDIMIEHTNSKTMFLGDNAFVGRLGNFDSSSSIHGNIEVLQYAISKNMIAYVPGHGPSGNAKKSVEPFLNYMKGIQSISKVGYEDDLESYELKDQVKKELSQYSSWSGFHHNMGKHLAKMYEELEKLDE
jgi:glyoxylase-like metal-dependent hydrolase (beta-lactamase superfamily II)